MTVQQVPRSFNSDPQHSWIYGLYVHLWQHASSSFGCIGKRFSNVIISIFRQMPLRNILNLMSIREQDVLVAFNGSPTGRMARPKYSVTDGWWGVQCIAYCVNWTVWIEFETFQVHVKLIIMTVPLDMSRNIHACYQILSDLEWLNLWMNRLDLFGIFLLPFHHFHHDLVLLLVDLALAVFDTIRFD